MNLPPLKALVAFEAAARLKNFTLAAREVCLTHGAISRQIAQLEDYFGQSLFLRQARGVALTETGERLFRHVAPMLSGLSALGDELRARTGPALVRVSLPPSFGAHWLMPRLPEFYHAFPDIAIELSASLEEADLARDGFDFEIRYGKGEWPEAISEKLCSEALSPVCHPDVKKRLGDLASARLGAPLLHDVNHAHWESWLKEADRLAWLDSGGMIFNDGNLLIEAALNGFGIAMGRSCLVDHLVSAGRLVEPFTLRVESPQAYYLARTARALQPAAERVWQWLLHQGAS
ncbi:LysR substrate-binding domain-containing protein [Paludibacterium paludis]|uniref:Transcriptional regulator GcvA n=1 Tax=Paludibacterium paludis TaxID=1225769 RepID=A0A918P2D7_9NEIS|nr:LysR substrate-binding domain-containing protein [Paludibacterium paludis]GGY12019.1 transcriptional regulator GcvA [Paludibacterium paludis]